MKTGRSSMNCHQALKTAWSLHTISLILLIVVRILRIRSVAVLSWIVLITAILLLVLGSACAVKYCVCPHCGTSFMNGIFLPPKIPDFCPHCNKEL